MFNYVGCDSFYFIVVCISLALCAFYMITFFGFMIIKLCKRDPEDVESYHDTISSSIYNANQWYKRPMNVLLGYLAFILICLHLDEYDSRINKDSQKLLWLYILEIIGAFFLGGIGAFPGGTAYRDSKHYKPWVDTLHTCLAGGSLALLNFSNFIYGWQTRVNVFGGISIAVNALSSAASIFFIVLSMLNISQFSSKEGNLLDAESITPYDDMESIFVKDNESKGDSLVEVEVNEYKDLEKNDEKKRDSRSQ